MGAGIVDTETRIVFEDSVGFRGKCANNLMLEMNQQFKLRNNTK